MSRPRCRNCAGTTIPRNTRYGLCDSCYSRWNYAGRPDTIPEPRARPARMTAARRAAIDRWRAAGQQGKTAAIQARLTDYARMRSKGRPLPACAAWLGVSERTAQRYERRLRETA